MKVVASDSPLSDIKPAQRADLSQIRWLLDFELLPSSDLTDAKLKNFIVVRDDIGVAAVVGIEQFGRVALLRSLVVSPPQKGRGLARRLVTAVEERVRDLEVQEIYLLTTSAASFFEHLGFRRVNRQEAPHALKQSTQFKSLCPSTAVLMVKP